MSESKNIDLLMLFFLNFMRFDCSGAVYHRCPMND